MNLARGLEQRLEKLVDGATASVFGGTMHPIDVASRLVRQLEFLAVETAVGPEVPNDLILRLNSADIEYDLDRGDLSAELENVVTQMATQRGWRLLGPVTIQVATSRNVARGVLEAKGVTVFGPVPAWSQLIAEDGSAILSISLNRTLIGRSLDSDIRVANAEISRHHAIIYRQEDTHMAQDQNSTNGTFVNGARIADKAVPLVPGDSVALGSLRFTYRTVF